MKNRTVSPHKPTKAQWVSADAIEVGDLIEVTDNYLEVVTNLRPFDTREFGPGIRVLTTFRGYARFPTEFVKRWVEV